MVMTANPKLVAIFPMRKSCRCIKSKVIVWFQVSSGTDRNFPPDEHYRKSSKIYIKCAWRWSSWVPGLYEVFYNEDGGQYQKRNQISLEHFEILLNEDSKRKWSSVVLSVVNWLPVCSSMLRTFQFIRLLLRRSAFLFSVSNFPVELSWYVVLPDIYF